MRYLFIKRLKDAMKKLAVIKSVAMYSYEGRLIARNVDELHNVNNINRLVAKDEQGKTVNGRGDRPNVHDILTGATPDGRASTAKDDTTCGNWTKSGAGRASRSCWPARRRIFALMEFLASVTRLQSGKPGEFRWRGIDLLFCG